MKLTNKQAMLLFAIAKDALKLPKETNSFFI